MGNDQGSAGGLLPFGLIGPRAPFATGACAGRSGCAACAGAEGILPTLARDVECH